MTEQLPESCQAPAKDSHRVTTEYYISDGEITTLQSSPANGPQLGLTQSWKAEQKLVYCPAQPSPAQPSPGSYYHFYSSFAFRLRNLIFAVCSADNDDNPLKLRNIS